jgi:DNA-binding NarL/FixJ family response regulator
VDATISGRRDADTRLRAMLDAALAAIAAPAFFVDARGRLVETNAAGRAWLERDGGDLYAALREAAARPSDPRFRVISVAAPCPRGTRLFALRAAGDLPSSPNVAAVAARWTFTARQTEVLALLVDGLTNRTIAATLGVAVRTVEVHITAMLDKAQLESRAELVAAVWRGSRAGRGA